MEKDLQALIDGLNEDLANEYSAIIMYNHNAATVSGLYRQILKPFFQSEIADEQGHALYLAEKIKTLGGTPTTQPKPVKHVVFVKCWKKLETLRKIRSDVMKNVKSKHLT